MNRFAHLCDRLAFEPARNGKLRLLADYFATAPDPDRGYALAALTGTLSFRHAKPSLVRQLMAERVDPVLFKISYDDVGDLSETAALLWPKSPPQAGQIVATALTLHTVVQTLETTAKHDLPTTLAHLLDALDETGRWALLKLITGGLRIGVSVGLAKAALARLGGCHVSDIEDIWHGVSAPYTDLFAWLAGHGEKPKGQNPTPFRSPMLASPFAQANPGDLDPQDYAAEWKWDGIRVQAVTGVVSTGETVVQLWSRSGEDITPAFPDLVDLLVKLNLGISALDGELLVVRAGQVQSFQVLQQRLNRKSATPAICAKYPAHLRAYDLLQWGTQDLRSLPFRDRRRHLEDVFANISSPGCALSKLIPFESWADLAEIRANPQDKGAGTDGGAVEGLMLKRWDSAYVAGRPMGAWWKWKREPYTVDAVMLYAQKGHGKRSSYYSDFTFGVWRQNQNGRELVPVGKAYFGFKDAELKQLDKWVRTNTTQRFGPVREVTHTEDVGLVLEIAFEGLNRSTRHKSGLAMRFPRIARIRWDKPSREADPIESLEALLKET